MTATAQQYRYCLPKKAIKTNCPDCGPRHRKTLSRYVDTKTGEPLPELYGRCDRESNCGYHLSPYHKTASGLSYADEVFQQWKDDNPLPVHQNMTSSAPRQPAPLAPVYCIPDSIFRQSVGHYENNQLARLLCQQFGQQKSHELLKRFSIGTSSHWPGSTVFWIIDERNRVRGGQVVLFAEDWHKAKYATSQNERKPCITSVYYALRKKYEGQALPNWLPNEAPETWPTLFGLPQLATAPADLPIAIVEAPKTAIVCSAYISGFVWLAVGGKSYLNAERLAPLRGRKIRLYPDLNAYYDIENGGRKIKGWLTIANELQDKGFSVEVSDLLENIATDEQRKEGLDLADYLLIQPPIVTSIAEQLATPGSILCPDEGQLERLTVDFCDEYPSEWDTVPAFAQTDEAQAPAPLSALDRMKAKNPALDGLINTLNLELVETKTLQPQP